MNPALFLLSLCCLVFSLNAAEPNQSELTLLDGSKLRGKIVSATASEVTIMTDFGVFRLPLEKLTAESRASVTSGNKRDSAALLQRIAELEARVAQLQSENESLRRAAAATPAQPYRPLGISQGGVSGYSPSGSASIQSGSSASTSAHTISSTGKRHNSGCRYYGVGRACGPSEGIACKICGG